MIERSSWRPCLLTVPPERVKLDPGRPQGTGSPGWLPAGQRAHAQYKLGEMERLGQVIVGAEAQARHPVAWLSGRGEHQDHGPLVAVGNYLAERVAAGLAIQATTGLRGLAISLWGGLGVLGIWAAAALVLGALALRLRDA